MPIYVTVKDPWSRVVCYKPEGDIIRWASDTHYITSDRILIVIYVASGHADDVKIVSVQMHRVLIWFHVESAWICRYLLKAGTYRKSTRE